jgi:hypothetical protein
MPPGNVKQHYGPSRLNLSAFQEFRRQRAEAVGKHYIDALLTLAVIVLAIICVDAVTLAATGVRLEWNKWAADLPGLGLLCLMAVAALVASPPYPSLFIWACVTVIITVGYQALIIMGYLGMMTALPFQDARLAAADALLGLHWENIFHWMLAHPQLAGFLSHMYSLLFIYCYALLIVLAASKRYVHLLQFVAANLFACFFAFVIAAAFPAIGAYGYYHIDTQHLPITPVSGHRHEPLLLALRNHPAMLSTPVSGIVTFPSYHAALAALMIWASRAPRWLLPIGLLVNIPIIAATPVDGGHYFTDILAGIILALISIRFARTFFSERRVPGT